MVRIPDPHVEEHAPTGWATFSPDYLMRYRLRRLTNPSAPRELLHDPKAARTVFLLLNPSTATAFKPDPTVTRCIEFARRWGSDIVEVVNLFAYRATNPRDMESRPRGQRGDDATNDAAIADASDGAMRVVAAWGNHGCIDNRAERVRFTLRERGVRFVCLGKTDSGAPKHPIARGKHFVPYDFRPVAWP